MRKNRFAALLAALSFFGVAACGGGEEADITTEEIVTEPAVETVEVPVMTQDTSVVQTEIDIDTDVDTVDLDEAEVVPTP